MIAIRSGCAAPLALALLALAPARRAHADAVRLTLVDALARADRASAALGALAAQRDASAAGARRNCGARLPQVSSRPATRGCPTCDAFTPTGVLHAALPEPAQQLAARARTWRCRSTPGLGSRRTRAPPATSAPPPSRTSRPGAARCASRRCAPTGRSSRRARHLRRASARWRALDAHVKAAQRPQGAGPRGRATRCSRSQVERERTELVRLRAAAAVEVAGANLARLAGAARRHGLCARPRGLGRCRYDGRGGRRARRPRRSSRRPELRAADERTRAAEKRKGAAQGALLPQVSLLASALTARPNDRFLPRTDAWNSSWSVGVSASWSIFDGGRSWADAAQRAAQARAAELGEEDLARRVRQEVTARRLDLASAVRAQAVADSRRRVGTRERARGARPLPRGRARLVRPARRRGGDARGRARPGARHGRPPRGAGGARLRRGRLTWPRSNSAT